MRVADKRRDPRHSLAVLPPDCPRQSGQFLEAHPVAVDPSRAAESTTAGGQQGKGLDRQVVVLHEGATILAEYPVSSGIQGHETPPGLCRVQMMEKGPIENVPGVFVSDILIFHWGMGIGIHSMPTDAQGKVLDSTLGQPVTGGCVRVGESARVFEFAEVGMRVWVH